MPYFTQQNAKEVEQTTKSPIKKFFRNYSVYTGFMRNTFFRQSPEEL